MSNRPAGNPFAPFGAADRATPAPASSASGRRVPSYEAPTIASLARQITRQQRDAIRQADVSFSDANFSYLIMY
jgi:hypothetical protein